MVHIVTRKHLSQAMEQFPDAATEIAAWTGIVEEVRWQDFAEVRQTFKDSDHVNGTLSSIFAVTGTGSS